MSNFFEIALQPISFDIVLIFLVIIFLLLCSALISGAEVSYFSLTPKDLEQLSEDKSKKAKSVLTLLKKPNKLLATILIVNNFINITIIILTTYFTSSIFNFPENSIFEFLIQVVVITFLIVLFGEITPKVYANRNAFWFSKKMSIPLILSSKIFLPLSYLLTSSTAFIDKRLKRKTEVVSMDEIAEALELTTENKHNEEEQKILKSIVEFGNIDVKEIMKSRVDVVAIEQDLLFEKVIELVVDSGFSRIPVYKNQFDDVVGILYVKDLIPHIEKLKDFKWQDLIRPAYFVPETKMINDLLKEFQEKKIHLAIVVDEYGGTSGIVTLEDILEEIVGDINDEFDDDGNFFSVLDEHNFIFEGKISLNDFLKTVKGETDYFDDVKGDSDSLAGLILELKETIPKKGEVIKFAPYTFKIESSDSRKIKRIKVQINKDE
ncbi:MAG: gliding motility-associated protein GldE [Flavobacteriales bacterium]|nr:gliding motility-associated protein GldE [Flavobacteriales bacterium]